MLLGYALTAAYIVLFASLVLSAIFSIKQIKRVFKGALDRNALIVAAIIVLFFIIFSAIFVHPAEQLYFDENIYQGIALNILHNGNALWCQYGTAYVDQCYQNQIYHDPVEWSFYLAIAFLIFGPGQATAYAFQVFAGALAVFLVFLLASLLFDKRVGAFSAIIFALIPELFIWSRTQMSPDLGLMMFSTLAFLCYAIYERSKTNGTLAMFLAAMGIAIYIRTEAALLIPIFFLVYIFGGPSFEPGKRIYNLVSFGFDKLLIFGLFIVLLIPQAYYISYETSSLNYGSGFICNMQSNQTFSLNYFTCNVVQNTKFFLGQYNAHSYYPAYFSIYTTIAAIIGFVLLLLIATKWRRDTILLLGLWILLFHLFYDFFYAGSVTYGVDVRFMLQVYPPLAILAGLCVGRLGPSFMGAVQSRIKKRNVNKRKIIGLGWISIALLFVIFILYPFITAYSTITTPPSDMPQQQTVLAATNFILSNYTAVPAKCLVFSFTPDVWYELNRSSAQIGMLASSNPQFDAFASNYTCFVIDYGFWCNVPPYEDGSCRSYSTTYNLTTLASEQTMGSTFALYRINDYSDNSYG